MESKRTINPKGPKSSGLHSVTILAFKLYAMIGLNSTSHDTTCGTKTIFDSLEPIAIIITLADLDTAVPL